ncbi:MAG: hypothetical protein J6Z79_07345 [Clostridia bacterium]|nr:hypothetical protein [Clostridia bacterium]
MKKQTLKTILFLVLWTLVLGAVYWSFSETPYTLFVSAVYAVSAVVLFIFFLLVNGGWRPLRGEEEKRARLAREKDGSKEKKSAAPSADIPPRPDLFHLGAEKQERAARILLMTAAPFFFILAADYIYLHFFFKG